MKANDDWTEAWDVLNELAVRMGQLKGFQKLEQNIECKEQLGLDDDAGHVSSLLYLLVSRVDDQVKASWDVMQKLRKKHTFSDVSRPPLKVS